MGKREQKRREREHRYNKRRAQSHGHGTWSGRVATAQGVTPGWCATKADIEDAKKMTHDTLIQLMGDTRDGPVSWLVTNGAEADKLLNDILASPDRAPMRGSDTDSGWREVRAKLRADGGYLVIAMAPGRP